jgi:sterol desaturase/sphingolipid hydroxylase (fatty acid hydroxylase superfamily)
MFDLSRAGYYADFILMPAFLLALVAADLGIAVVGAAGGGLLLWTLAEYLLHRFVFHHAPILRAEHDRHHNEPAGYIGVSSIATVPSLVSLWLGARYLFGGVGDAAIFGFITGYVAYIVVHDRFHHGNLRPGELLYQAHHRHALHHRGSELNFGVTVPWWDMMFGTYRR